MNNNKACKLLFYIDIYIDKEMIGINFKKYTRKFLRKTRKLLFEADLFKGN